MIATPPDRRRGDPSSRQRWDERHLPDATVEGPETPWGVQPSLIFPIDRPWSQCNVELTEVPEPRKGRQGVACAG